MGIKEIDNKIEEIKRLIEKLNYEIYCLNEEYLDLRVLKQEIKDNNL
tara:strand:+ start:720 stop:860 length:141 start_codon:yes stop_codon:yes gene_type:complete